MRELVEAFVAAAAASGAAVHHVATLDELDCLVATLTRGDADRDVAVARAVLGVAETGSVLIVDPPDDDPVVPSWPSHCVVVVSGRTVVADLISALTELVRSERDGGVFLSGPSADGPRAIDIVVTP